MQRPHTPPAHVYLATPASDSPAPAITEVHLPARRPAPGTRVRTPRVPGGNGRSHSPQDPVLNAGPRPWTPTVSSIALTPTPPPHLRLSAGSSNGGSLQRTGRPIPLVVPGRGRSASNVSASDVLASRRHRSGCVCAHQLHDRAVGIASDGHKRVRGGPRRSPRVGHAHGGGRVCGIGARAFGSNWRDRGHGTVRSCGAGAVWPNAGGHGRVSVHLAAGH
ncbi:hypothetical protein BC828DRAFT_399076 [Blastocladiella britannica]|nr:hypothetical protein BC828DRAFT_399076 [Blastocladiella britannica]